MKYSKFLNAATYTGLIAIGMLTTASAYASVTLTANGLGDTYELIESKNVGIETPDCGHSVRHIREVYDGGLNKYVFAFDAHRNLDDDRCTNTDRQRTEIKTSPAGSPAQQHTYGETAYYRWKFKLPTGFQPSPSFTHIHQIKAFNGSDEDSPLLTISPRSGNPNVMQIIFNAPQGQSGSGVKAQTSLSPFINTWVEAFVQFRSHDAGNIQVTLKRLSDGATLLSWNSGTVDTWRAGASYNRGKWGIYRSLNNISYLRDETVLFADWCFTEAGASDCPSNTGNASSQQSSKSSQASISSLRSSSSSLRSSSSSLRPSSSSLKSSSSVPASSSSKSSSNSGGCSGIPLYKPGVTYKDGDTVQHVGSRFSCIVGGWCTVGGPYEPGVGWAWTYAWTKGSSC